MAGHVGFEPANPSASYLTGIPWQLCLKQCKPGGGPFACELRDTVLPLRPTFQQTIFRAADTAAPERRRTNRAMSVLDLTGPRCTRCSFAASHVTSL